MPVRRPARPTSYPIGTRLAENYGLDLDREAREGLPGDRLGMRPVAHEASRRSRAIIIYVLVFLASIGYLLHAMRRNAVAPAARMVASESRWPDLKAAVAASAVADGWVPAFVPETATDLRVWRDAPDGRGWLRFTLAKPEMDRLASRFEHIQPQNLGQGPAIGWWPPELRGTYLVGGRHSGWVIAWTGRSDNRGGEVNLALDFLHGYGYIWRGFIKTQ